MESFSLNKPNLFLELIMLIKVTELLQHVRPQETLHLIYLLDLSEVFACGPPALSPGPYSLVFLFFIKK